jgi:hypothetical protein
MGRATGYKDIENRSWKPSAARLHFGRFAAITWKKRKGQLRFFQVKRA